MQATDEAALIDRCRQGDPAAWEAIYRQFAGRVRQVVAWSRWGFGKDEVDDFVQEVFLELARALQSFRGEASLHTFILRLARNKCVSHLRKMTAQKRGREAVTVSIDDAERPDEGASRILAVDTTPGPEDQLVGNEEVATLLTCMARLSDDCQTILRLRYARDMAYDEICRTLDLPLGTVCSRLKRCIDRLRTLVARE